MEAQRRSHAYSLGERLRDEGGTTVYRAVRCADHHQLTLKVLDPEHYDPRDIERLKNLPTADFSGMSTRIDALVAGIDALPLAFDERVERPAAAQDAAERGFWARLAADVWSEARQLVVVRQISAPEPPLLAPTQAYFVRENLRLRLLNARLSLLTRDEAGYREDLRAAQAWMRRYFDTKAKATADALAQLKQLSSTSITFEVPLITESLEAVRGFKSRRERTR